MLPPTSRVEPDRPAPAKLQHHFVDDASAALVEGVDEAFADGALIGFQEGQHESAERSAPKALPIGGENGMWTILSEPR